MKVQCIKILDEDSGSSLTKSTWLTVNKIYSVLSIHKEDKGEFKFQVLSDNEVPAFHNADQFTVFDNSISAEWVIDFKSGSHLTLTPKAWATAGFWEAFFDGESTAKEIFEAEMMKIQK